MLQSILQVLNTAISQLEKFLGLFIKQKDSGGIIGEAQQMPGCQLVTKRLCKLEEVVSQGYKYALHCKILQAFELLPWLLCTDTLVDEILPILDKRSNCVSVFYEEYDSVIKIALFSEFYFAILN